MDLRISRSSLSDENREFARFIAAKLAFAKAPVAVLLPDKGISALDAEVGCGTHTYDD